MERSSAYLSHFC